MQWSWFVHIFYIQLYRLQPSGQKDLLQQDDKFRVWGTPTGIIAKTLQVDFMPSEKRRKDDFSLIVGQQKYPFKRVDPGQQLRTNLSGTFLGETTLQVMDSQNNITWEGTFIPATKHEKLAITEGFVAIAPIQDSPGSFEPNGRIALFGWLIIGGIAVGIRFALRHSKKPISQSVEWM